MNPKDIKYLVVHCSDSPNDPYDGRLDTAEDVHRWHMTRGWSGVGYHFLIREDAILERGRPTYWEGAHVSGHNHEAIGIMLFGIDKFSDGQLNLLRELLEELSPKFPNAKVVGHYDLDPRKTCPNFDVQEWWNG